jgi:hypothetical protein
LGEARRETNRRACRKEKRKGCGAESKRREEET